MNLKNIPKLIVFPSLTPASEFRIWERVCNEALALPGTEGPQVLQSPLWTPTAVPREGLSKSPLH